MQQQSFFFDPSQQETAMCPCRGGSVYLKHSPLFVDVLLTLCWASLGKRTQTAPAASSDTSLTRKHPSFNTHGYNIVPAQALVFGSYETGRKGSVSPWRWIGVPPRMELLEMSPQRLILPPSSVPWSNAGTPLSLPVIRFQKGTSCTHFPIAVTCFFMAKPRRH